MRLRTRAHARPWTPGAARYDRADDVAAIARMKPLRGIATAVVPATADQCFSLLAAVDGYPRWYPEVVRDVQVIVTAKDGRPSRAHTTLHVGYGPLAKDFPLVLAIALDRPRTVRLTRLPNEPGDDEQFEVIWRLEDRGGTQIELELDARLDVPRLLPIGGIGDVMADGFVHAAVEALDTFRAPDPGGC
jgi:ribosome-associated toxin RatA of RatAB toxin-antitoxin module